MATVNVEEDLYVLVIYENFAYLGASDVGRDLPHLPLMFSVLFLSLSSISSSAASAFGDGVIVVLHNHLSLMASLLFFHISFHPLFFLIPFHLLSSTALFLILVSSSFVVVAWSASDLGDTVLIYHEDYISKFLIKAFT